MRTAKYREIVNLLQMLQRNIYFFMSNERRNSNKTIMSLQIFLKKKGLEFIA